MKAELNLIFYFYRYVQPIWYLNLRPNTSAPYWLDYRTLSMSEQGLIEVDTSYTTEDSKLRNAAYQAWQKGIICTDRTKGLALPFSRLPIKDEYRFISRYFNPVWFFYVLMIRLLSFRNPLIELYSFFKTRNVKRVGIFKKIKIRNDYELFSSTLVNETPKVSVVIPTLNRQIYLKDVSTCYFSTLFPEARIISIEPESGNFMQLVKNTNSLENVKPLQYALWKNDGVLAIDGTSNETWSFKVKEQVALDSESTTQIDAVSIDTLINQFNLECIDVLKIDIEGAEYDLFLENYESWLPHVKYIMIELHDGYKKGCSTAVMKALAKFNFSIRLTRKEIIVFINNDFR